MATKVRATSVGKSASGRVEALAFSLQDTNQNLRAVERMLQDLGDEQTKSDEESYRPPRGKARSHSHRPGTAGGAARDARTGINRRSAASDRDELRDRGYRNPEGLNVQIFDSVDTSRIGTDIHDFHQSLRDLTSGQQRIAAELEREKERGRRLEAESRAKFVDDNALDRVDRRLQRIDDEFKVGYFRLLSEHNHVL